PPATPDQHLMGLEGVASTTLAPQGVVLIASEQWTAVSTSGAIPAGSRVRVVAVDGLRVRVEPVENRPEEGYPIAPPPRESERT
ncbi:MAG: NfeD family protein, partial [Actinobacteria bacterium]|nr:NfeD family protein [Actinomycetota bacterium]